MLIKVHRWPILERPTKDTIVRTKQPTASLDCHADTSVFARGIVHIRFPGIQGLYDFRLTTGECTVQSMDAYVIDPDDLVRIRKARDALKKATS